MTTENDLRYVIECQKNVMEAQRQMISLQQQMLTTKPKKSVSFKNPFAMEEKISVPRRREYVFQKTENVKSQWTVDAYMKAHKISQRKMSELTGISQPTISRYMKGENIPNVIHAKSIRDATEGLVDIDSWRLRDD